MGQQPIDLKPSTQWAIANVKEKGLSKGIGVSETIFDLVNIRTVRAHRLRVRAVGTGGGPLPFSFSPSSSMSNYAYFSTYRPVNFDDFDDVGARVTSASALLYTWTYLALWDGGAYKSKQLAYVRMTGWGISTPGGEMGHGRTQVVYGDGEPLGDVDAVADIEMPVKALVHDGIKITAQEEQIVLVFPGDVLFDFDKDYIKPGAESTLKQAGVAIASIPNRRKVYFNGYTDSKGLDDYNRNLSKRRAKKVSEWFVSHGYLPTDQADPEGYGPSNPVAPNRRPDGSDNPDGRAKNRRVEIVILKRES